MNRRMVLTIGMMFAIMATIGAGVWAGLSISPAYLEVSLDQGRPAGEFYITNIGTAEERYRISAVAFRFTEEGLLERLAPNDQQLAAWIIFNPKEFVLPAGTRRIVRFVIAPHGVLQEGEYAAAMELESLNTQTATSVDKKGRSMKIKIVSTIMVPIFAQTGKVLFSAAASDAQLVRRGEQASVVLAVSNTGSAHIATMGKFEIVNGEGQSVVNGNFPKTYILRQSKRLFDVPLSTTLPTGNYSIRAQLSSAQLSGPIVYEGPLTLKTIAPTTQVLSPPVQPRIAATQGARPTTVP